MLNTGSLATFSKSGAREAKEKKLLFFFFLLLVRSDWISFYGFAIGKQFTSAKRSEAGRVTAQNERGEAERGERSERARDAKPSEAVFTKLSRNFRR